jgi:hypothetical protein
MQEIHQLDWIKRMQQYQRFIDLIEMESCLFDVLTVIFLCNLLHIDIVRDRN